VELLLQERRLLPRPLVALLPRLLLWVPPLPVPLVPLPLLQELKLLIINYKL
jgi:hypothetical protein